MTDKPYSVSDNDPDEGEIGEVQAHFSRGDRMAGFSFKVFQIAGQARSSYDTRTTFGPELARYQQRLVTPSGATVSCVGGSAQTLCHAVAGRTLVFVTMDGESVDTVKASVGTLVDHVAQLER